MKKIILTLLLIALMTCPAMAQRYRQHTVQIVDEFGDPVTNITSITIFNVGLSSSPTIYNDRAGTITITNPMTTSSDNSTFVQATGSFRWFQRSPGFKLTITDGTKVLTVDNMDEGDTRFAWYANYIGTAASLSVNDNQSISVGTENDMVLAWNNANDFMSWIPAADGSAFNLGTSGTGANVDFNWFVGTALGIKGDEGAATLIIDGLTTSINTDSNFNTNINTGTSTGNVTIGGTASGTLALDTTAGATINADDSIDMTTSEAAADIDIDAAAGSVIIDGGEAAADAVTITASTAVGGIDITSNADIDITTTGEATEDITIANTGGSVIITASEADAGAILIQASAAGGDLNLDSQLGRIEIEAEEDVVNAVYIIADGGTITTLEIFNDTGTSVTEGAASIEILSDVGGVEIQSNADLDDALVLRVDGGTTSEILIHNDQGNTADSIEIISDAGGITISTGAAGITFSNDIIKNFLLDVEVEGGTAETVLAADSGKVFMTTMATGTVTYTLPTAATGLVYTFIDSDAAANQDLVILAAAGDTINSGVVNKKYNNVADEKPASVTIIAVDAGSWEIKAQVGTWANDDT